MSNSNYNFRTAFNQVKEAKKYQRETEVDQFLKEVITKINEDDDIYENMLEEILFLQTDASGGSNIEAYIKITFPDEYDEDFPYQKLFERSFASFSEACNLLDLLSKRLEDEDFSIKTYDGGDAIENGKSFIMSDIPR